MTTLDDLAAAAEKALAASLKSDGSGRLNVTNFGGEWNTLMLSTTMCHFIVAADPTTVLRLVAVARQWPAIRSALKGARGLALDHDEMDLDREFERVIATGDAALAALEEVR